MKSLEDKVREFGEENVIKACRIAFWKARMRITLVAFLGDHRAKEMMKEAEESEKACITDIKNSIDNIKSK